MHINIIFRLYLTYYIVNSSWYSLAFGSIGFTQSQISTAYAFPSDQVKLTKLCVYGAKDLRDDLNLVDIRSYLQGNETIRNMINL